MYQSNSKRALSFIQSFRAATPLEKIVTVLYLVFFLEWILEAWIQNAFARRNDRFPRTTLES